MKAVFRVDASARIGAGHVMRCLTLADQLSKRGAAVAFVCREHPGHLCETVIGRGFQALRLPAPSSPGSGTGLGASWQEDAHQTRSALQMMGCEPDWLITDHYAIDARWESALRDSARHLMAIDDLADRPHECDLLLDQNYYRDGAHRYDALTPAHCRRLLGPGYALLRPEFADRRRKGIARSGEVRKILAFFGCSVLAEEATAKALDALLRILPEHPGLTADIVVPPNAAIAARCAGVPGIRYHQRLDDMAGAMAEADLALGACGTATWERCALGLPAIVLALADNQRETARDLANVGAIANLDDAKEVAAEAIEQAVRALIADPGRCAALSRQALAVMDQPGGTVADFLFTDG